MAIAIAVPAGSPAVPQEASVPSLVKTFPDCPDKFGTIALVEVEGKLLLYTVLIIFRWSSPCDTGSEVVGFVSTSCVTQLAVSSAIVIPYVNSKMPLALGVTVKCCLPQE